MQKISTIYIRNKKKTKSVAKITWSQLKTWNFQAPLLEVWQ